MMDRAQYDRFIAEEAPAEDDVVCEFMLSPADGATFEQAAAAVAAAAGTVRGADVHPAVTRVDADDDRISVVYPPELLEYSNLSQILAAIAGNVYDTVEAERLRLLDVTFPATVRERFSGPQLGGDAVKQRIGAGDRPLLAATLPGMGSTDAYADAAYDAWRGGMDLVVDPAVLTSLPSTRFDDRVEACVAARDAAVDDTGEEKLYVPNITAPVAEMKRRADLVADHGGSAVAVTAVTAGWAAVQELRQYLAGRDIGIHAHAAQHAAVTRPGRHGIAMPPLATFARLAGVDTFPASTRGRPGGTAETVADVLRRDWPPLDAALPVVTGGVQPGMLPAVVDRMGTGIMVQAGRGIHAHPGGVAAGAEAFRAAADAVGAHKTLDEKAEEVEPLQTALDTWSREPV
ncbi:MAG: RuBisCO large subunit C-terminal-like domain-containing protein [Candidatus Nanohaloarchaea archaeon]